jgi:hypothetical protein
MDNLSKQTWSWEQYRIDSGALNLAKAFEDRYGRPAPDMLIDVVTMTPIRSTQMAALALATAWAVLRLQEQVV